MEWKMERPGQRETNIDPSFFDNTEELNEAEGCDKAFLFKEFIRLQNERKELDRLKHQIEYEKEELKQEMTKWTKQLRGENDRLNQEKIFFDKKFKILENGFRQLSNEKESLKKENLEKYTDKLKEDCKKLKNDLSKQKSIECYSLYFFVMVENAEKTKVLLENKDIHLKKAILCCKAHHSRRSHLYYSMVFPEIEILVHPVVVDGISREDWYKTAEGRKVVLGEFSRMGQQLLMMEGRIAWD